MLQRLRQFGAHARGNVAMIFALALPALVLMTLGGVDLHRASTVKVNLQDALDAAALAAVRQWRFVPAQRGGEPVAGVVTVPLVFRLEAGG